MLLMVVGRLVLINSMLTSLAMFVLSFLRSLEKSYTNLISIILVFSKNMNTK
jgi:hypothetical protein